MQQSEVNSIIRGAELYIKSNPILCLIPKLTNTQEYLQNRKVGFGGTKRELMLFTRISFHELHGGRSSSPRRFPAGFYPSHPSAELSQGRARLEHGIGAGRGWELLQGQGFCEEQPRKRLLCSLRPILGTGEAGTPPGAGSRG